jgi:hypothetical protein
VSAGRTIIFAGSLAQKPGHGGHTWVFLQWLLGLRRLGWDVLFLDELQPHMCVDAAGTPSSFEASANRRYFLDVMERFGLAPSFSLIYNGGERFIGVPEDEVLRRVRGAALLINVMGYLSNERILGAAPRRVFLDIDPGFGQMWRELGLADPFQGNDAFITVGENVGKADCEIPTCGLRWITTRQPIVLEHWPAATDAGGAFTSVGAWRGPYGPVQYRGKVYGLRAHEFRKFVRLPRMTGERFEVALDIHPDEVKDLALLRENGWALAEPRAVAGDPAAYQDYVRRSKAEFMVAKNMYVQSRSGWFSDRSICYLASGKPVLAQDTGLSELLPCGEGLVLFQTPEEAAAGVKSICQDYARHARAARRIAEEFFDSDRVLRRLLVELEVE